SVKQNMPFNEENEMKRNTRKITLPMTHQIPNVPNIQQQINNKMDERMSTENINENNLYNMMNRKLSTSINKFNNHDQYYPYDSYQQQQLQGNNINVMDIRNVDKNENNIFLLKNNQSRDIQNNCTNIMMNNNIPSSYITPGQAYKLNSNQNINHTQQKK
ncbi:hypothetical protein PFTANZ_05137, partial [Plasmodium falciparum Tanzania (2000708)]